MKKIAIIYALIFTLSTGIIILGIIKEDPDLTRSGISLTVFMLLGLMGSIIGERERRKKEKSNK